MQTKTCVVHAWLLTVAMVMTTIITTTATVQASPQQLRSPHKQVVEADSSVSSFTDEVSAELGGDYFLPRVDPSRRRFTGPDDDGVVASWGESERARNVTKHHPRTYDEAASIVRAAKARGSRVRALGTVHSFSKVLPEDGNEAIFLDNFRSISQDPHDYSIVTLQAGVTNVELADWADSPDRKVGRFSYLPQNVLVQAITFVGGAQTGSHGSGNSPPTPDYIQRATFVDANGYIQTMDRSHSDFPVLVMSLGLVGIILEVTVKFDPSTSGARVTETREPMTSLFPLPGTPINQSFNPLKRFIESHDAGIITYNPLNSALCQSGTIDKNKLWDYYRTDRIWTLSADYLPGLKVKETREHLPAHWGTQREPYYDKDLFVPLDFTPLPSRYSRLVFNATAALFPPAVWAHTLGTTTALLPPSLQGNTTFDTSRAFSQHFTRYLQNLPPGYDYSFGFRVDDDYENVYKAWWAMLEESARIIQKQNGSTRPLIFYAAIRWVTGSASPLSAAYSYGDPSAKFVFFGQTSLTGTPGWTEYTDAFLNRLYSIRSKNDGSLPKPHWAKANWAKGLIPYIKAAMPDQLAHVREVVQRRDPTGVFRNK